MSRMRDKISLENRSKYVKKIVEKSSSTDKAVKKLAKQLFLSIATIYNDLAK